MKTFLQKLFLLSTINLFLASPLHAMEDGSIEQQLLEAMVKTTIIAFENPYAQEALGQFSELIKDENTYQYIIQKIDKFILTNELDEYEEQAENLKDALTKMRELYIQSEQKTLEKYNNLKEQQQEREKQRELKANNVIEV